MNPVTITLTNLPDNSIESVADALDIFLEMIDDPEADLSQLMDGSIQLPVDDAAGFANLEIAGLEESEELDDSEEE